MEKQLRRKLCFYLVIAGFGFIFLFLHPGCEKSGGTANIAADFEPAYLRLHRSGELKKKEIVEWIVENLSKDTYLNIMSQYRPMHKAFDYPEISRRITREEYNEVLKWAREAGLTNLDIQGF